MITNIQESFIKLVRLGIGMSKDTIIPNKGVDWPGIKKIAEKHGLSAVVLGGIEKVRQDCQIPLEFKLQWIGEVLQEYEGRYKAYEKVVEEMAAFYNSHGYKMMVLKGYVCSLDWPKPVHRPCGDIDIWLFGHQIEADANLARKKAVEVDTSKHHHTTFYWGDFMVENHYDFINTHRHYSHRGLEQIFKELGQDDSHYVELKGEKIYIPSPNLHALFLIRHALNHFASIGINLRQVLDWAFFWKKHGNEVDAKWFNNLLKKYYMQDFFNIINAICVEDLGFNANAFPYEMYNLDKKEQVLKDILSPEYDKREAHASNFISRLYFKYRRWKGSKWKRRLCYKERDHLSFFWSMYSHLLKPSTI